MSNALIARHPARNRAGDFNYTLVNTKIHNYLAINKLQLDDASVLLVATPLRQIIAPQTQGTL